MAKKLLLLNHTPGQWNRVREQDINQELNCNQEKKKKRIKSVFNPWITIRQPDNK